MSLINQMLQDLDARRSAQGAGSVLPNDVYPLPKRQPSRLPVVLGSVALLVLAGGFALYQWQAMTQAVAPVVSSVPVVVAPAAVPDQPALRAAPPVLASDNTVQPVPPASTEPTSEPAARDVEAPLRLADSIGPLAEKKPATKTAASDVAAARPAPAVNKPSAEPGKTESVDPSSPIPAPAVTALPEAGKPGKPLIEKTDAVGSPRERAEAEYRRAIVAVNQGRVGEALEGLRHALRQDGFHVASRQLLVKLLLEAKSPEEAMQVLQDGLQGQPAQLGWAMSLARLQFDRGDLAGAWQTLDYSLPAAGSNPDYQGFAAHLLQRLGRNREAAECYLAATRLSPGDGRWWLGLGLALEAEGHATDAREAFQRARQSGNLGAELISLIERKLR